MAAHLMHMAWIRMIEEQMAKGGGSAPKPIPSPVPPPSPEPVPPTPEPIILPINTLRVRFSNADTDPSNLANGTWSKVSDSEYNDWDCTRETTNWGYGFSSLKSTLDPDIRIIGANISNVQSMASCFRDADGITEICPLDVSNVTTLSSTFEDMPNVKKITLLGSPAVSFYCAFGHNSTSGNIKLEEINVDMTNATNIQYAFSGCKGLKELPIDVSKCKNTTNYANIFKDCDFECVTVDVSNATSINGMFKSCKKLKKCIINGITTQLTSFGDLFWGAGTETDGDVYIELNGDTLAITNVSSMFREANIKELPKFDSSNVTNWGGFSRENYALEQIPLYYDYGKAEGVSAIYQNTQNVKSGIADAYTILSKVPSITSYQSAFNKSGINTETGLAERKQVPKSWGGDR